MATFSLERLCKLARDRSAAYYERKEELQSWVVLGAIALDGTGNMGLLEKGCTRSMLVVGPAMLMGDYVRRIGSDSHFSYSVGGRFLPDPEARCPVCTRGWSIENWWDATFVEAQAFHKACRTYVREATNQEYFENAFTAAGYNTRPHNFHRIPNEYWTVTPEYGESWLRVEVPFGFIKVGWRKRVIELTWGQATLETQPDFSKEETTQESRMIHAWGFNKLIEYLKAIRECAPKEAKAP